MSQETTQNTSLISKLLADGISENDEFDASFVQGIATNLENQLNNAVASLETQINNEEAVRNDSDELLQEANINLQSSITTTNNSLTATQEDLNNTQQQVNTNVNQINSLEGVSTANANAITTLENTTSSNTNAISIEELRNDEEDTSIAEIQEQLTQSGNLNSGVIGLKAGTVILIDERALANVSNNFQRLNGELLSDVFKPGTTERNDLYTQLGSIQLPDLEQVAFDMSGTGHLIGSFSGTGTESMYFTLDDIKNKYEEIFISVNTNIHDYTMILNTQEINSSQSFAVGSYGNREVNFTMYSGSTSISINASDLSVYQFNIYGKTEKTRLGFWICLNNSIDPSTTGGSGITFIGELTCNADYNMQYHKLVNLADPTTAYDAVNKRTLDASIASVQQGTNPYELIDESSQWKLAAENSSITLNDGNSDILLKAENNLFNEPTLAFYPNRALTFEDSSSSEPFDLQLRYNSGTHALEFRSTNGENTYMSMSAYYDQLKIDKPITTTVQSFNEAQELVTKEYVDESIVQASLSNTTNVVYVPRIANFIAVNPTVENEVISFSNRSGESGTSQLEVFNMPSSPELLTGVVNYTAQNTQYELEQGTYRISLENNSIACSLLVSYNSGISWVMELVNVSGSTIIHSNGIMLIKVIRSIPTSAQFDIELTIEEII